MHDGEEGFFEKYSTEESQAPAETPFNVLYPLTE